MVVNADARDTGSASLFDSDAYGLGSSGITIRNVVPSPNVLS